MKYDVFPYPLENVSATLDIFRRTKSAGNVAMADGTHKGGEIRVTAQS